MARLKGQVVEVTRSGDLVTDIKLSDLDSAPRDDQVRVGCEGHMTSGIYPTEHGQAMTPVAFLESSRVRKSPSSGDYALLCSALPRR